MAGTTVTGVAVLWPLAIIASAGVGLAVFGKKLFSNIGKDAAEDDALIYGTPENVARMLYAAMGWGSSDEDEILRISREEIPSRAFFEDVKQSYRKIYSSSLLDHLGGWFGGLSDAEMKTFLDTINAKR